MIREDPEDQGDAHGPTLLAAHSREDEKEGVDGATEDQGHPALDHRSLDHGGDGLGAVKREKEDQG